MKPEFINQQTLNQSIKMTRLTAMELCQKILQKYGGRTAEKASEILLQDPNLKSLKPEIEFVTKNWRDPLRPAMIELACEAVEGKSSEVEKAAIATSLMNLSFYLWDDLIDKAPIKKFKPTFYGKFGENTTIIIGGIISAKAFTILNQAKVKRSYNNIISELTWKTWTTMANSEIDNLKARSKNYRSKDKFLKIKNESGGTLENCLKIGATLGNATEKEIKCLGKYGFNLGVILELQHDIRVSLNLTLELSQKISSGAIPFALLLAKEQSIQFRNNLEALRGEKIEPKDIEQILSGLLQTKVLEEIGQIIKNLSQDAVSRLNGFKKNSAQRALQIFGKEQSRLFEEVISWTYQQR